MKHSYEKENNKNTDIYSIILIIAICFTFIFVYTYAVNKKFNDYKEYTDLQIRILKKENDSLKEENENLRLKQYEHSIDSILKGQDYYDDEEEEIVYVTDSGTKYHRSWCSYLKSSNPITKEEAIEEGYFPCSRCNP